jgi:tripartite-type tricarboxylate transporter receptor subunit TctC
VSSRSLAQASHCFHALELRLDHGERQNTPADVIERLNTEINAALADAKIKARLADLGSTPLPLTASGYAKLLADETEKWGQVVKFSGAKAE